MKQHENNKKNRFNFSNKIVKSLIIFFGILFLTYNLISSQTLSPLYYQIIVGDQKSLVIFLEKIKLLKPYEYVLKMNQAIYGNSLIDAVFAQDFQKKQMINILEQKLVDNPKERDILYSLYQLYSAEGNQKQAAYYLRQAKEVDPLIK